MDPTQNYVYNGKKISQTKNKDLSLKYEIFHFNIEIYTYKTMKAKKDKKCYGVYFEFQIC